jgi:hypothetical protein
MKFSILKLAEKRGYLIRFEDSRDEYNIVLPKGYRPLLLGTLPLALQELDKYSLPSLEAARAWVDAYIKYTLPVGIEEVIPYEAVSKEPK